MRISKNETIKWSITLAVVLTLWFTGWHRPLLAGIQRMVLHTGLIQPDITAGTNNEIKESTDFHLIDESGNALTLGVFEGYAVFINIWATWCPPCKAEMPGIQSVYEEMQNENIQFVMISTDRDFELAKEYKKRHGFTFPVYRAVGNFPPELDGQGIPRTYVLDKSGSIRMEHSGMAGYNNKKFKDFLTQILNED